MIQYNMPVMMSAISLEICGNYICSLKVCGFQTTMRMEMEVVLRQKSAGESLQLGGKDDSSTVTFRCSGSLMKPGFPMIPEKCSCIKFCVLR